MISILQTEFIKLKRYNILLSGIFMMLLSVVLTIFTSTANDGSYWDFRYLYEQVIKNNMTLVFPVCITLISGYIMNREYDDNTIKNILTVPISYRELIFSKLIVCAFLSVIFGIFSFIFTIIAESIVGFPNFTKEEVLISLYSIVLNCLLLYFATMPIIVLSWKKQKGYLLATVISFLYGYGGLIASSKMSFANIYPITASLGMINYRCYDMSIEWNRIINILSISFMILVSIFIVLKSDYKLDSYTRKSKNKKVQKRKGW